MQLSHSQLFEFTSPTRNEFFWGNGEFHLIIHKMTYANQILFNELAIVWTWYIHPPQIYFKYAVLSFGKFK